MTAPVTVALTQSASLLLLFVVIPVVVGVVVMLLISRHSPGVPPGARTSEIMAHGERAEAEVLSARALGSPLDLRPMIQLRLQVFPEVGESFELVVVQSLPRRALRDLGPGTRVVARLAPGRTAGAIVPPD